MMSSDAKPTCLGQQPVRPLRDLQPPLDRLRLAVLVEGHDHHGRTVAMGQARLSQELRLTLLERERVDDGPTLCRSAARPR